MQVSNNMEAYTKKPIYDLKKYLLNFVIPNNYKMFVILDHVDFSILTSQEKNIVSKLLNLFTTIDYVRNFSVIVVSSNEFVSEYYRYTTVYIPCFSYEKYKFFMNKYLTNSIDLLEKNQYYKEYQYTLLYEICAGNCSTLISIVNKMKKEHLNLTKIMNIFNSNLFWTSIKDSFLKQHYKNFITLRNLNNCEFLLSILFTENALCSTQIATYYDKSQMNQVYKKLRKMQKLLIIKKISTTCNNNETIHAHNIWYSPLNKYVFDYFVSCETFFQL